MLQKKICLTGWDAAVLGFVALSAGKRLCPIYYSLSVYDADYAHVVTGAVPKSLSAFRLPAASIPAALLVAYGKRWMDAMTVVECIAAVQAGGSES